MRGAKLFIEIVILAGVMLALGYCIELKYRSFKTPADLLFEKYEKVRMQELPFTIIIGNSHTGEFHRYYPDTLSPVLNLSVGGQDLFREYTVLKKVISGSKGKIKIILLGLDYDMIGYNQVLSGQGYIDKQYFKHVDTLYKNNFMDRVLSSSSFFRANRDISFLFSGRQSEPDQKQAAFIPLVAQPGFRPIDCKSRAKEHTLYKFNKNLAKENTDILRKIIELCASDKIRLVILTTPKSECYRNYADANNTALGRSVIRDIVSRYKVTYIDLYDDTTIVKEDYTDYDHLNDAGIKKVYTKIRNAI
ncbi:MAG: hypothetical protein ACJ76F_11325 [Bacteroidia bacterium]